MTDEDDDLTPQPRGLDEDYWEEERIARQICPHCAEPIGSESSGTRSVGEEWQHLACLQPPYDRQEQIEHALRRSSLPELQAAVRFAADLLVGKWKQVP